MACPCKLLKDSYSLPVPIGTKVFVIAQYSRNDWYETFEIEERTVEAYIIDQDGLSRPQTYEYARSDYAPITKYCASKSYFTDRAKAEKELERIQAEYKKARWGKYERS